MNRALRILFVEDMPDSQKVGLRLFQAHGHRAKLATNGREAVAMFATDAFDLVVMDLQMPEMDGWQAAREIRRREGSNGRVPIIAVSAYSLQSDRGQFEAAGIDAFVAKPIDNSRLMMTIEALCRGGPQGSDDRSPTESAAN
jgi:CheY-like chemotaxis protein